jgi:RNA polymerase sigma-70 factor (subfamily 1)
MATHKPERDTLDKHQIEALIVASRGGCAESLGRLTEHYRWYLLRSAAMEVPEDVHVKVAPSDLVQETFLLVQRGLPEFRGVTEEELRAWLRQILLNLVSRTVRTYRGTQMRDVRREISLEAIETNNGGEVRIPSGQDTPSTQAATAERARLAAQAFEQLPPHYREVIRLRNVERLKFGEIGELTGRTEDAARQMWLRALDQLRERLTNQDGSL